MFYQSNRKVTRTESELRGEKFKYSKSFQAQALANWRKELARNLWSPLASVCGNLHTAVGKIQPSVRGPALKEKEHTEGPWQPVDQLPLVRKEERREASAFALSLPSTMVRSALQFRRMQMRWNGSLRRDGQLQVETVLRKGLLLFMSASNKFSSVLTESC